jgi:NADH oxidase (H2O-forming)
MQGSVAAKKISILYISPHGSTETMAHAVARGATTEGIDVVSYHISDLSAAEVRSIMEQADALVFGIPTVSRDIPKPMWDVLAYLGEVKLKTKIAARFGSYCWSGETSRIVDERLKRAGLRLVGDAVPTTVLEQCQELGRTVAEEVTRTA